MPRPVGYRSDATRKRGAWATWLDDWLLRYGVTYAEAARILGVAPTTVASWATGHRTPSVDRAEQVREALAKAREEA